MHTNLLNYDKPINTPSPTTKMNKLPLSADYLMNPMQNSNSNSDESPFQNRELRYSIDKSNLCRYSSTSKEVICEKCKNDVNTSIEYRRGKKTIISMIILSICCLCWTPIMCKK